jgi:hypothetical protein
MTRFTLTLLLKYISVATSSPEDSIARDSLLLPNLPCSRYHLIISKQSRLRQLVYLRRMLCRHIRNITILKRHSILRIVCMVLQACQVVWTSWLSLEKFANSLWLVHITTECITRLVNSNHWRWQTNAYFCFSTEENTIDSDDGSQTQSVSGPSNDMALGASSPYRFSSPGTPLSPNTNPTPQVFHRRSIEKKARDKRRTAEKEIQSLLLSEGKVTRGKANMLNAFLDLYK